MTALFAGLTTLDVLHRLDHVPDPLLKVTSTDFTMAAGGPATNAAVTYAALSAASRALSASSDEAGATSCTVVPSAEAPTLLTALGEGPVSAFLAADLAAAGVRVLDATALTASSSGAGEHPARPLGVPKIDGDDPFAPLEALPPHPRILDGGSWKEWLTPLLGFVDIAVVSEDFAPPLMAHPDGAQVAEFLRGFGITRTVRTRGDRSVQYWWDGASGEVPVDAVPDASTLGAGDAFHGAFTWAIERGGDADPERLIRFASAVAAVSVSSFGTRQWLTSPTLVELVRGW